MKVKEELKFWRRMFFELWASHAKSNNYADLQAFPDPVIGKWHVELSSPRRRRDDVFYNIVRLDEIKGYDEHHCTKANGEEVKWENCSFTVLPEGLQEFLNQYLKNYEK